MDNQHNEPTKPTVMDRIIADALEKAQRDALDAAFGSFRDDDGVRKYLREQVIEYLKTPEGRAKVVAVADQAIEKLRNPSRW